MAYLQLTILLSCVLYIIAVSGQDRKECTLWHEVIGNLTRQPGFQTTCAVNNLCTGLCCNGTYKHSSLLTLGSKFNLNFLYTMTLYPCDNPVQMGIDLAIPEKNIKWSKKIQHNKKVPIRGLQYSIAGGLVIAKPYLTIQMRKGSEYGHSYLNISAKLIVGVSAGGLVTTYPSDMQRYIITPQIIPIPDCAHQPKHTHPVCYAGSHIHGDTPTPIPVHSTLPTPTKAFRQTTKWHHHNVNPTKHIAGSSRKPGLKGSTPGPEPTPRGVKSCELGLLFNCPDKEECVPKYGGSRVGRGGVCQCLPCYIRAYGDKCIVDTISSGCTNSNPIVIDHLKDGVDMTNIGKGGISKKITSGKNQKDSSHTVVIAVTCGVVGFLVIVGITIAVVIFTKRRAIRRYRDHELLMNNEDPVI